MRYYQRDLAVDRAIYRIDYRTKTYRYLGRNTAWPQLTPTENARNKRQLHGYTRIRRDGTRRRFLDPAWPYTEQRPCPTCYGWSPRDSPCDHPKYECPTCGRRQCLQHWVYPMQTEKDAIHFLKGAEYATGTRCFIRNVSKQVDGRTVDRWKIFTSQRDYEHYQATGRHLRTT